MTDQHIRANFVKHLLNDIEALDIMLDKGLIEKGVSRIGAEQEFCLVNDNWRPSKTADSILRDINDEHFTTELAQYNLEINLDPLTLKGDCFSAFEAQLNSLLNKAQDLARKKGAKVLLAGILPTISKNELELDYISPNPRYKAINDMIISMRGSDFQLNLKGVDELSVTHDSVLFEACNTSFQLHLQISPEDFISSYNWAQAISGPVLGVCTNSPLLLGRELWSETRIALFQQSIDTRRSSYALKDQQSRVTFGTSWAQGSIAEIFKNEISTYKVILAREIEEDSVSILKQGGVPKLQALNTHNGTIYRWNRPCYGVGSGKAHVRIENRYIPSGPSLLDELANFAFWVGIMKGRPKKFDNIPAHMDFRAAKSNFVKAARTGKESVMDWMGELISVRDLVEKELLPIAYTGLRSMSIDEKDIERLLGTIEKRAASFTGAQWSVKNFRKLRKKLKRDDALLALTKTMYQNQQENLPVHEWASLDENLETHEAATLVEHIMSTQLFTVNENDLADLATSIMKWMKVHHVPIEDKEGNLVGILTWSHMKDFNEDNSSGLVRVNEIMCKEVITTSPETEIQEAISVMKKHEIGCLPVVHKEHLVGIITIDDIMEFAGE